MGQQYDLISTFDVVHDSADPAGLLASVHRSLKPDGTYMLMEVKCSDRLEENFGPLGALFYGVSTLYCMTTALANDGEGLGTMGLPPGKVRELSTQAGFSVVNQIEIDNPINNLYEIRH